MAALKESGDGTPDAKGDSVLLAEEGAMLQGIDERNLLTRGGWIMCQYRSRSPIWVIALLVVTPLGGYRLAAQDGVASDTSADQPSPLIKVQSAPPATPAQEQPEVLNRGPVHEAFAEPVNMQLQAGLMAPDRPPPNIEEVPPAERPQGRQFAWIPGYWSWDAERNGYIWVSGCWRVAPPNPRYSHYYCR